jgi:hypothetical protein
LLGNRLCVVASRFSRSELDDTSASIRARWKDWAVYQLSEPTDGSGQPHLQASLTRMLPEVATWHRTRPAGIIDIQPWLTPTRVLSKDSVGER